MVNSSTGCCDAAAATAGRAPPIVVGKRERAADSAIAGVAPWPRRDFPGLGRFARQLRVSADAGAAAQPLAAMPGPGRCPRRLRPRLDAALPAARR
jgi:hypothetical protein